MKHLPTVEMPGHPEHTRGGPARGKWKGLAWAAGVFALAVAYFGSAKLGLALAFQAEQVTAVWPPTGISLAAVLLFGYRVWPGIALGAFLANITSNEPVATACGIAVGNTLEAVAGTWLLRKLIGLRSPLERVRDVLGLVALGAAGSTIISATLGVTSLCLGGVQPWASYGSLWSLWWLGDAAGAIVVAPLLLTWTARPELRLSPRRTVEAAALLGALALVSLAIFAGGLIPGVSQHPLEYIIFPFVVWAALRLGQPGTTAVTFVVSGVAIWGAVHGVGPFSAGAPHENLILLQAFMMVVAITALLLGAALSERRRTEEMLRQRAEEVEKLMEVMPVAVWIARDPDCKQITGNRAGRELLRLPGGLNLSKTAGPSEEAPGFRIVHAGKEVPPHELPMQYAAAHGTPVRDYEEEIVFDDGTIIQAYGSAMPLFDEHGKVRGCVAAFMDVTVLRRLEQQLRQKVEELAAADRRKDEFLATLAHELRNPLAPLRNAVELLHLAGDNQEIQVKARDLMRRQLVHLVRLIDDLLDVSRISRNKLQLRRERTDVATVIHSALEASRPLIEESPHELTVALPSEPVFLDADPIRLAQVFTNLLNNAAKYTEKGGHIRLTAERQAEEVVVSVRDTGIGIAAEHLPRLFEIFSQITPALERSRGGLGIGLSLARGLVELHGGRIEAHSGGPGLGSEFVVRLPLWKEEGGRMKDEPKRFDSSFILPPSSFPRWHVLVVDDNWDTAESLGMVLRLQGHTIRTAHDGLEAVAAAAAFRPDVVLLDVGLPKMNGYEAARQIRQQPGGANILLVAVTGWGQEGDKQRAAAAGFDHHLTKPIDPGCVLDLLARPSRSSYQPEAPPGQGPEQGRLATD